jgi:UV DNA damage endonuclease
MRVHTHCVIRFGLCCIFRDQPIKFRTTTAKALSTLPRNSQLEKIGDLASQNVKALLDSIEFCAANGIGCFRINSQILPLKTHPVIGYELDELSNVREGFAQCGERAREVGLRLSFHPDQFVVLNSPRPEVVESSLEEIEYQAEVAELVNADVVNIHGGGAYGDKRAALEELCRNLDRLSNRARQRITLENDDSIYTPEDLLPVCLTAGVPLVYDVHHHRCHPDHMAIGEATDTAISTWNREPLFHISSPLEGWAGPKPARHHDFIDVQDFPDCWRGLNITVEIEAKAKEIAVLRLMRDLSDTSTSLSLPGSPASH